MDNPIYTYRGKQYEIISHLANRDGDTQRTEQLLRDFQWCESIGDWDTIGNRITNGLKWGWLKEISFKSDSDIVQNVEKELELKGFW